MKLCRRSLASIGLSLLIGNSVASTPPYFLWTKQDGGINTSGLSVRIKASNVFVVGSTGSALSTEIQHGKIDYWLLESDSLKPGKDIKWLIQDGVKDAFTFPAGVGVDNNDNAYVAANVTMESSSRFYMILTKYTGGIMGWRKQVENAFANGIVTNNNGDSYVVGGIQDNFLLAKYNSNGELVWSKELRTPGTEDYGLQIGLNDSHLYVTGYSYRYKDMYRYFFIEKFKLDGTSQGRKELPLYMQPTGLVTDNKDSSIYVSGTTQKDECYLVKYNAEGNIQWEKAIDDYPYRACETGEISLDQDGNIYMTGAIDFYSYYFIAKFDAKGNLIWNTTAGSTPMSELAGSGIDIDMIGNLYVTGYTTGSLHKQPMIGMYDYFIEKYEV